MQQSGHDYDAAGLSFYPYWNGSFESLKENAQQLATTFHKEVLIAEAGYPSSEGPPRQEYFGKSFQWPKILLAKQPFSAMSAKSSTRYPTTAASACSGGNPIPSLSQATMSG
jgi:hypothetical protein